MPKQISRSDWRACGSAGLLIGVAIAGFLDGILLHQILQWHSLFSSLDGVIYEDLRFRMLTDGLFHAAMYAIGIVGLYLLWRARVEFASAGSGQRFASRLLVGFGAWHLTDAVVNHWLLGLHHIKDDSPNWLWWDVAFFALGLVSIGLGTQVGRSDRKGRSRLSKTIASGIAIFVVAAGAIAALPLSNAGPVTVVFRQGVSPASVLAAVESARGRIFWSNSDGDIWTVALENRFEGWHFYTHGALYVSGSVLGMGCFGTTPTPLAQGVYAPYEREGDSNAWWASDPSWWTS
ncbi:DUF2243 domain-containing protein [Neorhizobium sp. T786]|uniref:DUF2243 domain-containing protein n=1 Tax=Pseudorhizobium xiangyangii TaxID=2883104 RepID=UPI001D00103B|nr:DUF2243 domain-containing protein [Neorhizobium xiangyangii]MCB5203746.1 DUF2243 domain-containing protein [Neorhizobium xiangyangii]